MNCPKCGSKNRYDAVNCAKCGAPMTESVEFDEGKSGAAKGSSAKTNAAASVKAAGEKVKDMAKVAERRIKVTGRKSSRFFGGVKDKTKDRCKSVKAWFADIFNVFDGEHYEDISDRKGLKQKLKGAYQYYILSDTIDRRIALSIPITMLAILIILIIVGANVAGCSCSGASISGTWAIADETLDGYSTADTVIVLDRDGKVYTNGFENGSYELSEGKLTMNYGGMEFAAEADKRNRSLDLSLNGSDIAGMELVKISNETELTSSEIAKLYPDA